MGTSRNWVTVCNVSAFLTGEILASFLSTYGRVEDVSQLRSAAGVAHGDYVFRICMAREGFQAIPDTILSRETQMMVVLEGKRPHCRMTGGIWKNREKTSDAQLYGEGTCIMHKMTDGTTKAIAHA